MKGKEIFTNDSYRLNLPARLASKEYESILQKQKRQTKENTKIKTNPTLFRYSILKAVADPTLEFPLFM